MKAARSILCILPVALLTTTYTPANAAGPRKVTVDHERLVTLPPADQQRVLCIADRLEAITKLDRRDLSRAERKALRSEVKVLKGEADAFNRAAGGTVIYISGAGLLLIIILLIILL